MGKRFTHLSKNGLSRMVDVGKKPITHRIAMAACTVRMHPATFVRIQKGAIPKGNIFEVARLAGIGAAKQTAQLIPLCHPIALTRIDVRCTLRPPANVDVTSQVEAHDRTGVEMEALTAVAVAGLTVYDMCKAIDRDMEITNVRLLKKSGGRRGLYVRKEKSRESIV